MPSSDGGHLSAEEIEWFLSGGSGAAPGDPDLLEQARHHLAMCRECENRLQASQEQQNMLNRLPSPALRGAECPPEQQWLLLSAGQLTTPVVDTMLRHAAGCDWCGGQLRLSALDLEDALTMEEERTIAILETAQPDRQLRIAGELARTQGREQGTPSRPAHWWEHLWPKRARWVYAMATVGLVFMSAGTGWYLLQSSPERLLAVAYGKQRTVELRFESARYGPFKQQRGAAGQSRLDQTPALLEAEALIARKLASQPESPEWLQAKARADLLGWHYDAAIVSLKRAVRVNPESPTLLVDLASAYFERAEALDRAIDYGTAIELLGKALAVQPDNPVALFNRAIAYDRMFLVHQAIDDWEHYLKVDGKGDWANEARERLAALRKRLAKHDAANQPVGDAASFLRIADTEPADARIEDYLDTALRYWLPAAFPETANSESGAITARQALNALAFMFASKHHDQWLSDFLKHPPSPQFAAGVSHLSRGVSLNYEGDPVNAGKESGLAEQFFNSAGSAPGVLRARVETVYALDRSIKGDACLEAAQAVVRDLGERPYTWMRTYLAIQRSNCLAVVGELGESKREALAALAASRAAGLGRLELQSLGTAAAVDSQWGNLLAAWSADRLGLERYWQGTYSTMRAYQFEGALRETAARLGQHHLALGLAREAALAAAATPNRSIEAMARFLLANLAVSTNSRQEAEAQLARANELFASLPQDSITQNYRLRGEIGLAELASQRGDADLPIERLLSWRREIGNFDSLPVALSFYTSLGNLYGARGATAQAENAFGEAIRLADKEKDSLQTEPERLLWMRQAGDAYRSLVGIGLRQGADARKMLELWESFRSPAGARADRLQSVLTAFRSATLLSYAESRDGIAIWAADSRGARGVWVQIPAASLDRLARQFAQDCADRDTPLTALKGDGYQLYQWLIQPIEAHLDPTRPLVIEADGAISEIPLQALTDGRGRYFGDSHSLVWSPAEWNSGGAQFPQNSTIPRHVLVVGPPALQGETAAAFPPLPDAMREARSVASRFPNATFLSGEQASLESVERELRTAELFHFAGHGFGNASGAGLVLADSSGQPGMLDSARFQPAQFRHCQLAVLSACSTGTGESDEPVNPESLAVAFLRAGVRTVVAARWPIDSHATATLMDEFYQAYLAGQSSEEALRGAAIALRNRPETAHPYYWAAFSAFGSIRETE